MVNTLQNVYTGGKGYTGAAVQVDISTDPPTGVPGTAVAPTEFIPGANNGLRPNYERDEASVQVNSNYAAVIDEPGYVSVDGTHEWYPNTRVGNLYWQSLLGGVATIASVTATTTAGTTTTNGKSTHTITGAFLKGAPVRVGTGASMEPAIVLSYTAGTLVTTAVTINATAASGLSITQPPLKKFARSIVPAVNQNLLSLLTIERNLGGLWAWRFRDVTVESADWEISTGLIRATAHLYGNQPADFLNAGSTPAMAAYAPNAGDQAVALRPASAMSSVIALGDDPAGTGTSTVRAAFGLRTVHYTFNNNLLKEKIVGNPVIQCFPSDAAALDITWTELDTMQRPYLIDEYIKVSGGFSFHSGLVKNLGSLSSPDLKMVTFYTPYAKPRTSGLADPIGGLGTWDNAARAHVLPGGEQDLLICYITTD